jgi:hypothetical protein
MIVGDSTRDMGHGTCNVRCQIISGIRSALESSLILPSRQGIEGINSVGFRTLVSVSDGCESGMGVWKEARYWSEIGPLDYEGFCFDGPDGSLSRDGVARCTTM